MDPLEAQPKPNVLRGVLLIILGTLLILGCSTGRSSHWAASWAIERAKETLEGARKAQAPRHASSGYSKAKETLDQARAEFRRGAYSSAESLAKRAETHAGTAVSRTDERKRRPSR